MNTGLGTGLGVVDAGEVMHVFLCNVCVLNMALQRRKEEGKHDKNRTQECVSGRFSRASKGRLWLGSHNEDQYAIVVTPDCVAGPRRHARGTFERQAVAGQWEGNACPSHVVGHAALVLFLFSFFLPSAAAIMPSFVCDNCQDTIKKPKLDDHIKRCQSTVSCIDCSTTFEGQSYRSHTSCISEAEKYQKGLYKGPKAKTPEEPAKTPKKDEAAKKEEAAPAKTPKKEEAAKKEEPKKKEEAAPAKTPKKEEAAPAKTPKKDEAAPAKTPKKEEPKANKTPSKPAAEKEAAKPVAAAEKKEAAKPVAAVEKKEAAVAAEKKEETKTPKKEETKAKTPAKPAAAQPTPTPTAVQPTPTAKPATKPAAVDANKTTPAKPAATTPAKADKKRKADAVEEAKETADEDKMDVAPAAAAAQAATVCLGKDQKKEIPTLSTPWQVTNYSRFSGDMLLSSF